VSPFEQNYDHLRDMELGGSGQQGPDEDGPDPETDTGEGAGDQVESQPAGEDVSGEELQEELVEEESEREAVKVQAETAGRGPGPMARLYRGQTSYDFVGRKRWWFLLSSVIIVAGLVSLGVRGLNLGIDFKGGTAWSVKAATLTQAQAESLVTGAGLSLPTVEVLGSGSHRTIEVQADLNNLPSAQRTKVRDDVSAALAKGAHISSTTVSVTQVGPTWGSQVTQRAIEALIIFFIVVAVYISIRFEPKMALAAFIAMVHDLLVTVGVFSLAGFQVSPDTVIAVLTILGYSLYDTVVVFTRVRDNTKGFGASGRMTYSEMINLSMNQTLARSLNTSLVAILPVLSVLLIGAELLGATTLQDYGLALTVGLFSGAYSSIFIASPVLAMLKEREPRYATIRQRLEARGDSRVGLLTPAAAALAMAGGGAPRAAKAAGNGARTGGTIRPGAGKGGSRPTVSSARTGPVGSGVSSATTTTVAKTINTAPTGGSGASGAKGATGSRPSAGTAARRPPPRPRKGGGKSKGKKRR